MSSSPGPQSGSGVRGRVDACPGSLRLHEAQDGYLARIRVPGGRLTLAQARALGKAASLLGDGSLELTSRGNVQLRRLAPHAGGELAPLLEATGLLPSVEHDRVRNIVASPLSGLDGRGHLDISDWVSALDRILCDTMALRHLSGRFLIGLDDGRGDVVCLRPDITAIACADGSARLRLGEVDTPVSVPASAAARLTARAAEAFLWVRRELGSDVWRVHELPDAPRLIIRRLQDTDAVPPGSALTATNPDPGPPQLGVVQDRAGRTSLSVLSQLGRVSADQWRAVTAVAGLGGRSVRLTPWRGVVIPHVPQPATAAILAQLGAIGFVTSAGSPWAGATACAGRPGCGRSLTDVRHDATSALGATPSGRRTLPVHWSGCERRCGHPSTTHVEVVAGELGYHVGLFGQEHSAVDLIDVAHEVSSARSPR